MRSCHGLIAGSLILAACFLIRPVIGVVVEVSGDGEATPLPPQPSSGGKSEAEWHLAIGWDPNTAQLASTAFADSLASIGMGVDDVIVRPAFSDDNERIAFLRRFYIKTAPPTFDFFHDDRGKFPFTIFVIHDDSPKYERRETTHGPSVVNTKMFTMKKQLRAQGGLLHMTDDMSEVLDNCKVLGIDPSSFRRRTGMIYSSVDSFLHHINSVPGLEWLVLRNWENYPDLIMPGHEDFDILVNDHDLFVQATAALPYFCPVFTKSTKLYPGENARIHYYVIIDKKPLRIDLRHVGDDYYPREWEVSMLQHRRTLGNIFTASKEDDFYSLLYHALVHKPNVPLREDYQEKLTSKSGNMRLLTSTIPTLKQLLSLFLHLHNYSITDPKDPTVDTHFDKK